jgi:sulfite reductase (NADPH) flavoprotein alpha-component
MNASLSPSSSSSEAVHVPPGIAPETPEAPEPSALSIVGDRWPHLLLGMLLAMGILGVNPERPFEPPSPLIWLPPALLAGWIAFGVLFAPRPPKAESEEEYDEGIQPQAFSAVETPVASKTATTPASETPAPAAEAPKAAAPPPVAGELAAFPGVIILWGSETGTAQGLADMTQTRLADAGLAARSVDMGSVTTLAALQGCQRVLILTSTWGDGEPPSNGISLWEALQKEQADFSGMRFSVLALGDTAYPQFCQCGKDFDKFLETHGAKRIHPRVDCDLDYEAPFEKWLTGVTQALQAQPVAV